jgi:hypothetical protein
MRAATEVAMIAWVEGARRLEEREAELPSARRAVLDQVVRELVDELRRRVGSTFTIDQLAEAYEEAAAWCLDIAQRTTGETWAHDLSIVQDAAFARFARNATDFR